MNCCTVSCLATSAGLLQDGEVKPLGSHLTKHCNVRIIAATNPRLKDLI
jgi:transcriptional regulator with PAS, ATPase and Fis domain